MHDKASDMAESRARNTNEPSTAPTMGSSVICLDSVHSNGKKAISVMMELINAEPKFSMMPAKRMVSSCTRWAAPSMLRRFFQCDM